MKFTFKSEQYGTTVEMNFEGIQLENIEEMFKQFLKGSGFYLVEDKDENYVQISDTDNELDLPIAPDEFLRQSEREGWRQVKELQKELQQIENSTAYRLGLLMQSPEYKPWEDSDTAHRPTGLTVEQAEIRTALEGLSKTSQEIENPPPPKPKE